MGPWDISPNIFHGFYGMAHPKKSAAFCSLIFQLSNNVGNTIINHPPVITIFIGCVNSCNHSHMGGLWRCFIHTRFFSNVYSLPENPALRAGPRVSGASATPGPSRHRWWPWTALAPWSWCPCCRPGIFMDFPGWYRWDRVSTVNLDCSCFSNFSISLGALEI
jgi:hypothetical protein